MNKSFQIHFRWDRCMQQLAGGENRPGQLGDTGIIVLTKCDMGKCDCNNVLAAEKAKASEPKPARPHLLRSSSTSNATPTRTRFGLSSRTRGGSSTKEKEKESPTRRPFRQPLRSRPSLISRPSKVTKPIVGEGLLEKEAILRWLF